MSVLDIQDEDQRAADICAAALALRPVLEKRADEADQLRRIPDDTMNDLRVAGLTRLTQPRHYGGAELPLGSAVDALATLGGGCASASWVCGVYADHAVLVSMYPKLVTDEVWGANPEAVISAGFMPAGRVEPKGKNWRVSGRWGWVSGCDHADWFLLGAMMPNQDGHPEHSFLLVPASDVHIEDDWHVMGLKATGSKTITVDAVDVPDYRAISFAKVNGGAEVRDNSETRPLYRLPHTPTVPYVLVATSLGVAERLLDITVDSISGRESRGHRLAELQSLQLHVAEAAVDIDTARLLMERDTSLAMTAMRDQRPLTLFERARNRRDHAHVVRLCRRAGDRLFEMMGAQGMYDSNIIQRKVRDLRAAGSHIGMNWDVAATTFGQVTFGLPPTSPTV